MIVRRHLLALGVGGLAGTLMGCTGRHGSLRYRVTIGVWTPQGLREGGGVVETVISLAPKWLGAQAGGSNDTYGDAPYVMLDDGRPLFALLSGKAWRNAMVESLQPFLAYPDLVPPLSQRYGIGDWQQAFEEARRILPRGRLRPEDYPTLATFADAADPRTAVEIDPADPSEALGTARHVTGVTLEVVPDATPLTTGITQVLPWLTAQSDRNLTVGNPIQPVADADLSDLLVHGSFHRVRK